MRAKQRRPLMAAVVMVLVLCGCNLPKPTATPNISGTIVAGTLSALQTSAVVTQTALSVADATTPAPPASIPAITSGLSQNPLVTEDTLFWVGPGNQYEVVSAIRAGTSVELLGRATIPGWYIVRNPSYRDPCWIQASDLQINTSLDLSGLPYFSPPATPTPTPTNTPTITPTSTPSPTNTP